MGAKYILTGLRNLKYESASPVSIVTKEFCIIPNRKCNSHNILLYKPLRKVKTHLDMFK